MEKYNDDVHKQLPDAKNIFSAFAFGSMGFKIGKFREGSSKPWINVEFQFPYLMVTKNSFAFAGISNVGAGFQMSFQIPIGKNVPIGSKLN